MGLTRTAKLQPLVALNSCRPDRSVRRGCPGVGIGSAYRKVKELLLFLFEHASDHDEARHRTIEQERVVLARIATHAIVQMLHVHLDRFDESSEVLEAEVVEAFSALLRH